MSNDGGKKPEEERTLKVYPPIHKLGSVGKWFRQQLLQGEEEFYTLLVPLLMWVFEARLGRLLALLMSCAFYCAGSLKNTLCLPRPPVPPVVPLHRCQDWSLPSHHALLNVNVPWYLWFYMSLHYPDMGHKTLLFLSISFWSFLIMFSRMYLGVHSPADILTGGICGCLLLAGWLQVDLILDHFITYSGVGAVLVFISVAVVVLYVHPDPSPTTYIYDETTAMVGVAGGVVMGRAMGPANVMIALLERGKIGMWSCVRCGGLRFLLGLVMLVVVKMVVQLLVKEGLFHLCKLVGIPCVCTKRLSQVTPLKVHYSQHFITLDKAPEEPSVKLFQWSAERPLNLHMAVKLMAYGGMGVAAVALAPYVFTLLGI